MHISTCFIRLRAQASLPCYSFIAVSSCRQYLLIQPLSRPHCDSECNGSAGSRGSRVATAIVYCRAPRRGGAVLFDNANIRLQPADGSVLFFSYWGGVRTDPTSLTLHRGCPVHAGEKWIATAWMRRDMSAKYNYTAPDY